MSKVKQEERHDTIFFKSLQETVRLIIPPFLGENCAFAMPLETATRSTWTSQPEKYFIGDAGTGSPVTFNVGKQICLDAGGSLAMMRTQEEYDIVKSMYVPSRFYDCDSVVLELICYCTTANRLIYLRQQTPRKVWPVYRRPPSV